MLSGRAWMFSQERRIEDAFNRARAVDPLDPLSVDVAQHLVILVAGWMEQSAFELARERCRRHISGPVLSFSLSHLERTRNAWAEQLLALVGRFDLTWREELDEFITPERLSAINSVMGLRNKIAHGEPWAAMTSVGRVSDYFGECRDVLHRMADILDPVPA